MRKYHISSRYLDKCIRIIENNCYSSSSECFSGESLQNFCNKPKNLYALKLLEALGEVYLYKADGASVPYTIRLENSGVLHTYNIREKRKSAIKGFVAGVLSALLSTYVLPYVFSQLIALI